MSQQSRILIVDDNETNLRILEEVLGGRYELDLARSGEECLELAARRRPDLVLLDIMMPGIDGYETCRRLRRIEALRHLKIVLVSAKAMVAERIAGYEAGADDYVTKPFDEDELLAKLQVFLRLKSSEEVESLKSSILRVVGREIRGPLNGILAGVQMLIEGGEPFSGGGDEEHREWAGIVTSSCTRLLEFIERVELMDRLTSGRVTFDLSESPLRDLVGEVAERRVYEARTRGVVLRSSCSGEVRALVDAAHLRLVLDGLVGRAVQRTPKGGVVRIEAAVGPRGPELRVNDEGEPLGPEECEHLFEQLAESGSERGACLSLAVAREILRGHGGALEVGATPEGGTRITLALQAAVPAEKAVTVTTTEREVQG